MLLHACMCKQYMYAISCVSQLRSTTYLPIDALEFVDKTVSMIDAQLLRWVAIMLAIYIPSWQGSRHQQEISWPLSLPLWQVMVSASLRESYIIIIY